MNIEAEILDIKRTQQRIDSKLTVLLNKPQKETWVKVSFITGLTGWDNNKLRMAREQGLIKFKNEGNGFYYLLESLSPLLIKQTSITNG